MLQVALYVDTVDYNGTPTPVHNWRRLDLQENVNILLNDAIKDAKDVGKVLTSFTQQFTVPASKTNNQAMKYFYSFKTLNGFDSRRKHPALIKINGYDFKKGYFKLNSVSMRDNVPQSYSIQFFGELASLKDVYGNSELKDLISLSVYNHEYNIENTKDGLESGLAFEEVFLAELAFDEYALRCEEDGGDVEGRDCTIETLKEILPGKTTVVSKSTSGDIKYPLISHTRGFEYDSQGFHIILSDEQRDAGYTVRLNDRLKYGDLKPALRVSKIFDALETDFPQIKYNKTWLQSSPFNDMFVWLHRTKGYLSYDKSNLPDNSHTLDFTIGRADSVSEAPYIIGPDGDLRSSNGTFCTRAAIPSSSIDAETYRVILSVFNITGTGQVRVEIQNYKNGSEQGPIIREEFPHTASISVSTGYSAPYGCGWGSEFKIVADTTIVNLEYRIDVVKEVGDFDFSAAYGPGAPIALTTDVLVPFLMPKKTIVEFLTDLFKMFNLVAEEERDLDGSYKINILPLDDYYDSGTAYDITQYVDISGTTVERVSPYGSIDFDWAAPKTFLAINQAEITGDDFGAAHFNANYFDEGNIGDNSLLFDGGNYTVQPKVEKMIYERMNDAETDALTDIQWGWFVNDNKENIPEPTIGEILYLYMVNESPEETITWDDETTSTTYNRPSSVIDGDSQTLHFNAEFDEWTRLVNENSLFENYYSRYVEGVYSPYAKRFKCDAYLPAMMYLKIKLRDTVLIDNVPFNIERIKTNLTTGKSSLELLRITDEQSKFPVNTEGGFEPKWNTTEQVWDTAEQIWNNDEP